MDTSDNGDDSRSLWWLAGRAAVIAATVLRDALDPDGKSRRNDRRRGR